MIVIILRAMTRGLPGSYARTRIHRGGEPAQRFLLEIERLHHDIQRASSRRSGVSAGPPHSRQNDAGPAGSAAGPAAFGSHVDAYRTAGVHARGDGRRLMPRSGHSIASLMMRRLSAWRVIPSSAAAPTMLPADASASLHRRRSAFLRLKFVKDELGQCEPPAWYP